MRHHRLVRSCAVIIPLLAMATIPFFSGCGPGSGSSSQAQTQGGVQGFVFAPSSPSATRQGSPSIKFGRTETPPSGFVPLTDTVVGIQGGNSTRTDSRGFFQLTGVEFGLRNLVVKGPGGDSTLPISVLPGVQVNLGEPKVTRQQAAQLAEQAAISAGLTLKTVFMAGTSSPLPAGVNYDPALGDANGEHTTESVRTVQSESWFFYVDPYFNQLRQHPVLYILVDADSGAVQTVSAGSWPRFNGVGFFRTAGDFVETVHEVRAPSQLPPVYAVAEPAQSQTRALGEPSRSHIPTCKDGKVYSLVVSGYVGDGIKTSADVMEVTLAPFSNGGLERVTMPEPNPQGVIAQKTRALFKQMKACDTYVLYICTHNRSEAGSLQMKFQRQADDKVKDTFVLPRDFLLDECPACHIIVIQDVCFSGLNITRAKLGPATSFTAILRGLPGRDWMFVSGTDSRHAAVAYSSNIVQWMAGKMGLTALPGAVFTRALESELDALGSTFNGDMMRLVSGAAGNVQGLEQNPQMKRETNPGTCEGAPDDTGGGGGGGTGGDGGGSGGDGTGGGDPPPPANKPPVADAGPDQPEAVSPFTLDGSKSTDPDGRIVSYEWRSGGVTVGNTAKITLSRDPGTYTFLLIVIDDRGAVSTDSVVVVVTPLCTRVTIRNSGTTPITLLVKAENHVFNNDQPVTIAPGKSFVADNQQPPILGLNLIIVPSDPRDPPLDQGFNISVPCGREQVFDFGDATLSFDQVPLQ